MYVKTVKPLGRKAYGHIPHLPESRMGPGDHHCHAGQARIATERARDRHDRVVVTEKLDGSCCAIAKVDGTIVALTRAGYVATTSPYEQHHLFGAWVRSRWERFADLLTDGERVVGEWLAQAHGTRYDLHHEPFVVFDLMRGTTRAPHDEVVGRCRDRGGFVVPEVISDDGPASIGSISVSLLSGSAHGALDPVEGAVWRVERRGKFDFMCKWVRSDKVDGYYLSDTDPVWNWRPGRNGR